MIIVLVGPIDYWWHENWDTPQHHVYVDWRNHISKKLVEAGHLVYRPHESWKGAWDERAQVVNDAAIDIADIMINLRPPGIPAYGTEAEVKRFWERWLTSIHGNLNDVYFEAPPGDYSQIEHLIIPLDDPYGDVQRKSYTK